jgi:hypothetical protein
MERRCCEPRFSEFHGAIGDQGSVLIEVATFLNSRDIVRTVPSVQIEKVEYYALSSNNCVSIYNTQQIVCDNDVPSGTSSCCRVQMYLFLVVMLKCSHFKVVL